MPEILKDDDPEAHEFAIDVVMLLLAAVKDLTIEIEMEPTICLISLPDHKIKIGGPRDQMAGLIDGMRKAHDMFPSTHNTIFDENILRLADAIQKAVQQ